MAASAAYDLVLVAICKTAVAAVSRSECSLIRYLLDFILKKKMTLLENHL